MKRGISISENEGMPPDWMTDVITYDGLKSDDAILLSSLRLNHHHAVTLTSYDVL